MDDWDSWLKANVPGAVGLALDLKPSSFFSQPYGAAHFQTADEKAMFLGFADEVEPEARPLIESIPLKESA